MTTRRLFLSLLSAAGASFAASPLLAIPSGFSPPDKILNRTVGPLIKAKPGDLSTQMLEGVPEGGQFTLTMDNGETFVFQLRPSLSPRELRIKGSGGQHRASAYFDNHDVVRITGNGPIEVEGFNLSVSISRSDRHSQGTLQRIEDIKPPLIEASWREVSYT